MDSTCMLTNDYRRMWLIAPDLRVGELTINDHAKYRIGFFPFGGNEASGVVRECIGCSDDDLTEHQQRLPTVFPRRPVEASA